VADARIRYLIGAIALGAACFVAGPGTAQSSDQSDASTAMVQMSGRDNGRTIDVRAGQSIRIVLPENATTGYRWAIDHCDQAVVELVSTGSRYLERAIGAGGEAEFVFEARNPGSGEISLKQWRHWEGDQSILERFHLLLNVKP